VLGSLKPEVVVGLAGTLDLQERLVQFGRARGWRRVERGGIAGDEDVAEAVQAGALTDPEAAGALARRTGLACLAVSIGNVHGAYREPPRLDWERLARVRER